MAIDTALAAAFLDPVLESQAAFRVVLEAMSHPAQRSDAGPSGSPSPALSNQGSACAGLVGSGQQALAGPGARIIGLAPLVEDTGQASFALIGGPLSMPPLAAFAQGADRYPDRSTTLILQVEASDARARGIRSRHRKAP